MNVIHTLNPGSAAFAQPYEWGNFCVDVQRFGRAIRGELEEAPTLVRQANHHDLASLIRIAGYRREPISVDIETRPSNSAEPWTGKDPSRAALHQIGFGLIGEGISIFWEDADSVTRLLVKQLLADKDVVKVFQNGWWFDIPVLQRYGLECVNVEDTRDLRRAVASKSKLSLRYLGSIYTDIHDWKSAEDDDGEDADDDGIDGKGGWATSDKDAAGEYNALDCVVTARAWRGLRGDYAEEVARAAPVERLYAVHTRLSQIYARANRVGMYVHKEWRGFMRECLAQSMEEARATLRALTQENFPCTPDAMRALIYKRHEKPGIKGYGLPDPYDKKMYTDETKKTIKVDENSLLMLLVSGECPPPLIKAIDAWWHFKGEEKRLGVIKSERFDQAMSADGRLHPGWNSCGTETMRLSCSSPNVQNIEEILRHVIAPAPGHALVHMDKCVTPDTLVLKSDLSWAQAGTLTQGDELVGFDEQLGAQCKLRKSKVTGVKRIFEPCFRIVTDKGEVTSSSLHTWPVKRKKSAGGAPVFQWVQSDQLVVGDEIRHLVKPWEVDTSYGGAYLAGIFDGEGSISKGDITFTQNEGPILEHVKSLLSERDFNWTQREIQSPEKKARQLRFSGSREAMRFLGSVRPRRLMTKADASWEGTRPWSSSHQVAKVLSVEFVGMKEVVAFGTSTKTFIANGLMSHNSQLELRVMEVVADDHILHKALLTGDVYTFDALQWYKIDPALFHPKDDERGPANKKDKKTRTRAKIGHLSRQYGAGDQTAFASALRQDRNISFNEIRLQGKSFQQTYYRTAAYWEEEMRRVLNCQYSEGRIIGGRLYHPMPPERSKAANFPVQRTAGEMMNLETIELFDRLRAEVPDAELVAQVHDAIDVECKESDVEKVKKIMFETHDREWTFCGKTRPFPIDLKVAYSSLNQTWADV